MNRDGDLWLGGYNLSDDEWVWERNDGGDSPIKIIDWQAGQPDGAYQGQNWL